MVRADLIVGADGTGSAIRKAMFPGSERKITKDYILQVQIQKEAMYENKTAQEMYEDPSTRDWMGPLTCAVTSLAPNQNIYDI